MTHPVTQPVTQPVSQPVRPLLSVVVPFYNVEAYILDCLRSLQKQTLTDLEVILVDDGSQDGSLAISRAFCESDDRFRIVRQDNAGLGPARNTGVRHAHGEFLTFVDSDDLVPARAYEQMVRSLQQSGSDLACGDARRFSSLGVRASWVHVEPFRRTRIATHVREFPPLALDRMAWNKVYRRAFWDEHGFEYPAMLYEDYPVTIRAHVLARAVDVLEAPVYYWREREGGELSITQRKAEIHNLRDRAASAGAVLDFLAANAPELLPVVEAHFLHIDVGAIAAAVRDIDPEHREELLVLGRSIIDRCSREVRDHGTPYERIQNLLFEQGRLDAVAEMVEHRARYGMTARVRRTGRLRARFELELPFLDEPDSGVPRELYRVEPDEVKVVASLLDAEWAGDRLRIDLSAHVGGMSMEGAVVDLWLERRWRSRRRRVRLRPERFLLQRLHYRDDPSGLRAWIEPQRLGPGAATQPGFWALHVRIRVNGVTRTARVREVDRSRARWARYRALAGDGPGALWARLDRTGGDAGLELRQLDDVVARCAVEGTDLVLSGHYTDDDLDPAPVLQCEVDDGSASREYVGEARRGADGRHEFRVRVPARDVVTHPHQDPFEEQATWLVRLSANGRPRPLAMIADPDAGSAAVLVAERRVLAQTSVHGNLLLDEGYAHPLVTGAAWTQPALLRITGVHDRTDERPETALLRRFVTPADPVEVEVALGWEGHRFAAEVDVRRLGGAARAVDTGGEDRGGHWDLLLPLRDGPEAAQVDPDQLASMAGPLRADEVEAHLSAGRSARFRLHAD